MSSEYPIQGGCDCRHIRYQMEMPPLFVHCCHCRWCQRESGASFALNALIEASRLTLINGAPLVVNTPSESGNGQKIARCPDCHVAVWSNYSNPLICFIRVGTLDNPDIFSPDIHIYTAAKQPWVMLPSTAHAVAEYYDRNEVWPETSLIRIANLLRTHTGS